MTISKNNRLVTLLMDTSVVTPAFVYDEEYIINKLRLLADVRSKSDCHILYSIKALSFTGVLNVIAGYVDGFSVSSVFECQLAREILGESGSIHMTSPGIRQNDMYLITEYSDYISFNSVSQWQRYMTDVNGMNCGIRINPGIPYVKDDRYNPCRENSKLGVSLSDSSCHDFLVKNKGLINGVHIHNNCESENLNELVESINHVCDLLNDHLSSLDWINLGGGYLFNSPEDLDPLNTLVSRLKKNYELDIFFEPGKAIVGQAGYLIASVIDLFDSDNKTVAVLDTTINHLPEVFEYQYTPEVVNEIESGSYKYILAGASCLSGDLFGYYSFAEELKIGSKVIFINTGAYMSVKANMFNGINLPTVYSFTKDGTLQVQKEFDYIHYRDRL